MIRLLIIPRIPRIAPIPSPELAAKLRLVMAAHEVEEEGKVGIAVASKFEMGEMEVVR